MCNRGRDVSGESERMYCVCVLLRIIQAPGEPWGGEGGVGSQNMQSQSESYSLSIISQCQWIFDGWSFFPNSLFWIKVTHDLMLFTWKKSPKLYIPIGRNHTFFFKYRFHQMQHNKLFVHIEFFSRTTVEIICYRNHSNMSTFCDPYFGWSRNLLQIPVSPQQLLSK